jgi:hypothetical protein
MGMNRWRSRYFVVQPQRADSANSKPSSSLSSADSQFWQGRATRRFQKLLMNNFYVPETTLTDTARRCHHARSMELSIAANKKPPEGGFISNAHHQISEKIW